MASKRPYKPTGVFVVDLVAKCINHYAGTFRPVERIVLHPLRYEEFCDFVRKTDPEYVIGDWIDFDDVKIEKGSSFMNESMYFYNRPVLTQA